MTVSNSKKRLDYLDALRGFAILCVVAGHSTGLWDNVHKIISAFLLPVFFVISGYLMEYGDSTKKTVKEFLKKRFMGIMIPYFGFSILAIGFEALYGLMNHDLNSPLVWRWTVHTLVLYGKSALWFLPALFIGEILFFLIRKYLNHILTAVICTSLFAITAFVSYRISGDAIIVAGENTNPNTVLHTANLFLFVLLRACYLMPYLCVGYYFSKLLKEFQKAFTGKNEKRDAGITGENAEAGEAVADEKGKTSPGYRIVCILIGAVFLAFVGVMMIRYPNVIDVRAMKLETPKYLAIPMGILSSCGLLMIFRNFPKIPLIHEFLVLCGKNSLIIMATHLDFGIMNNAIGFAAFRNQTVSRFKNYVFLFHIFTVEAAFEIPIIYAVNRFFPFLAGKGFRSVGKARKKDTD